MTQSLGLVVHASARVALPRIRSLHVAVAFFAPTAWDPALVGSVYRPLMPLHAAGLVVFTAAEPGGRVAPSMIGWAVVLVAWIAVWWAAAHLRSRLFFR